MNLADPDLDLNFHFNTDPESPYHFDADQDPTFHFDAEPESTFLYDADLEPILTLSLRCGSMQIRVRDTGINLT